MKSKIMTASNIRAKAEGRANALRKSHKAAKGFITPKGKKVFTLAQQSRLNSNFKAGEQVESVIVETLDVDFGVL